MLEIALEVDRLTTLVKGVVGFEEKRGDLVTVIATKFEPVREEDALKWYENQLVMDSIKKFGLSSSIYSGGISHYPANC